MANKKYENLRKLNNCKGGKACPAVYGTEHETYLVIGKKVEPTEAGLSKSIGEGEVVIEVPKGLLSKIKE